MMGIMPQNYNNSSETVTGEIAPEPDSPISNSVSFDETVHDEFIWSYPDDISADDAKAKAISFEMILTSADWAPYFNAHLKADLGIITEFVNGVVELDGFAICCRFTHDDEIRQLNRDFRQKDKATNVLSFPDGVDGRLGDLAFAFETLKTEAAEMDITIEAHLRHLLVHGLLHLAGFDHADPEEAEEMEALEMSALALIGVDNPYLGELV